MSMSVSRPRTVRRPPLPVLFRYRRQQLEMSIEEAAARAGLAVEQWRALEAGEWLPLKWEITKAVCDALEIPYKWYALLAVISRGLQAQL